MKSAIAVAAALVPAVSTQDALADSAAFLEPSVQRHVGVVPASVCKQLIDLGEKYGFLEKEESIDEEEQRDARADPAKKFVPSQTIDVWEKDSDPTYEDDDSDDDSDDDEDDDEDVTILNQEIYDVIEPWIPAIADVVRENRDGEGFAEYYPDEPDREPELNWVFFRKYSPDDERNSLQSHHDTNMNTVNVALNDDYEGGGFFYIRPLASTGKIDEKYADQEEYGYKWIDTIKRENTSEITFPDLRTGDAVFYNYTVEHAVAPVDSGVRYSMAFFFDMDNPAVRHHFDSEDEEEEEEEVSIFVHNGLSDAKVDIAKVYEANGQHFLRKAIRKMRPNETAIYSAFEGDKLRALVAGTGQVINDFEVQLNRRRYVVTREGPLASEL